MKRKSIALFALAFALVLGMAITPAGAYFTDRSTANGGLPITVEPETYIYEWVKGAQKHIVVTNAEGSAPVFVRVQVDHPTNLPVKISGDGWKKDGGWYVYQDAVAGGGETTELLADIEFKAADVDEMSALVTVSDLPKCPRCWNHRELGGNESHPDVCKRCGDALDRMGIEA